MARKSPDVRITELEAEVAELRDSLLNVIAFLNRHDLDSRQAGPLGLDDWLPEARERWKELTEETSKGPDV